MDALLCLDLLLLLSAMLLVVVYFSLVPSASEHTQSTRITIMTPEAEKFNGWAAMIGIIAAFGSYATTGQLIPGIW